MKTKWDFCFLGACYPECHPESNGRISDVKHLKAKVSAGAEVLLSQLFFDNKLLTMCGATFPVRFQKIIHKYENNKEALFDAGMSYALSQIIDLLVNDIDGIHLYTMNNPLVARRICEGIRNII